MPARTRSARSGVHSSKKPAANKPRAARPTVLHLCADLEPCDPARETVDLAILTQRAGWRALIASQGGFLVTEAERAAVRHTRMPLGKRALFAGWRNRIQLAALVQKERPVLLHIHGIEAAAYACDPGRMHQLPLVADFTQPPPDHPRTHRILERLEKTSCIARVPSEFMARLLCDTFQWPAQRLSLIPPGIDMRWYDAGAIGPERLQALSKLWRLPEHTTVIVVPMPLTPGNGCKPFLQALAQTKRDDAFAVLVGDNRHARGARAEIEELINRFGLHGKVIVPDYCSDWPAACWLASVIVAPNTEPRGQMPELLAAQAIGRPVIATECGANPEMVRGGETAWVVPPGNARALAQALREAIHLDTAQRLDLAARTRDFVAGAFPQASWFNGMMDLYESVLATSGRRIKAA